MDATELKGYEQQLAQVQGALRNDPDNEELRTLQGELTNLIDLTKQLLGAQGSTSSSTGATTANTTKEASKGATARPTTTAHTTSKSGTIDASTASDTHRYAVGDECQAKYEADGRWYAARVVAIAGSSSNPMYTVLYKGYDQTEIVTAASLRPVVKSGGAGGGGFSSSSASHTTGTGASAHSASSTTNGKSKPARSAEEEAEQERKRRRSEKKADRFASRTAEVNAVQNSWQKFAKKAEKKGVMKRGGERSMFKTPDDPLAKVGVVGAGRGMTQYGDRKKHGYDKDDARDN